MKTNRTILTGVSCIAVAAAAILSTESSALAFGGSADRFPQQGNFVITNQADLGFTQKLNDPTSTSIVIHPALEYFVIPNLSIGGEVIFAYTSQSFGNDTGVGPTSFSVTQFGLGPEVGYDVSLSDTWSVWPKAELGFVNSSPNEGDSSFNLFLQISAPFLVHPAEHFFFGVGPALHVDLTGDAKTTSIGVNFTIGGYFGQ